MISGPGPSGPVPEDWFEALPKLYLARPPPRQLHQPQLGVALPQVLKIHRTSAGSALQVTWQNAHSTWSATNAQPPGRQPFLNLTAAFPSHTNYTLNA